MTRLARLRGSSERYSWDAYSADVTQMLYDGHSYPLNGQSWAGSSTVAVREVFPAYMSLLRACPPAFGAQLKRSALVQQMRFTFRGNRRNFKPGKYFGTDALSLFERPAPGVSTAEWLSVLEWHVGAAGNAFTYVDRTRRTIKALRPDWVTVVIGSDTDPDEASWALDGEVAGYIYNPGGMNGKGKPQWLQVGDVGHWDPLPDPEAPFRGMSWMTPVIREMQGDRAATEHKLKFFENAGTPNLIFRLDASVTPEGLQKFKAAAEKSSAGTRNAYKNLYLGGGADVTVAGLNMKELDFSGVQGAGENRIAVASSVPAAILGIKEGLAGSTLNAGNFGVAKQVLADTFLRPHLGSLCAAHEHLIDTPDDGDLWYAPDHPFLQEAAEKAAEINKTNAEAIASLTMGGFTPESAVAAVLSGDLSALSHSGLFSVQLQKPGTTPTTEA